MSKEDLRYKIITCAKCGMTRECTPKFDYYETHLWPGEGLVCEICFHYMIRDEFNRKAAEKNKKP